MTAYRAIRDKIDDYQDTVFAIIGFLNFYRYDDESETMKEDVKVFQGRRLEPVRSGSNAEQETTKYVTPDVGVLLPTNEGVLGDVKHSFPNNQEFWLEEFRQLMNYDQVLTGWPSDNNLCGHHDVVLLTHLTRAGRVKRYYEQKSAEGKISFDRPFVIIEYSRSNQADPFFFFRVQHGDLSLKELNERLLDGVPVPMRVFLREYSTVKLYDSPPPLPYLMQIVWEHIVFNKASDDPTFGKLKWNQKLELTLSINEIVSDLQDRFSFRSLHRGCEERQPEVPRKQWVVDACDAFVKSNDAEWVDESAKENVKYLFSKRHRDVFEYCMNVVIEHDLWEPAQPSLFANNM